MLAMLAEVGLPVRVIRCLGGGARSDLWLQMKADATGLPVERPAVPEAATTGAALLAATGAGQFSTLREAAAAWYRADRAWEPRAETAHQEAYAAWREVRERI
jgi:sugar (pentulose or hexulose) kinase